MITPQTVLVRTSNILKADLGSNAVALMSVGTSRIFGLEGPAGRIWELLSAERTFESLVDAVVGEYDIDRATCATDVAAFVAELERNKLVELRQPAA